MLRALSIRDYVIVDRLDLEFAPGFIALTGETGAGKSILVDALGLALGSRAETGVVRTGAERAEISAEFDTADCPAAREWLAASELDESDGACLLRRTVDVSARSRAFVNGRPASAGQLREIGERLLDIHGQNEHQRLLKGNHQRALLDAFGGHESLARECAARFEVWRRATQQRAARERAQASSAREREQLAHEIRDLEALGFDSAAWAEEQSEHRRLTHARELIETVQACIQAIDEAESAASAVLARSAARLEAAAALDPRLDEAKSDVDLAAVHVGEAAQQLRRYLQSLEVDPARLDGLDRRLKAVLDCARRYRIGPAEIPAALD